MSKPKNTPTNIVTASSEEEVAAIAAKAQGPVVLDFVASWCGGCQADAPKVTQLARSCPEATVIKVDVDAAPALADKWKVDAMPTLFVANDPAELQPGKAQEAQNAAGASEILRCRR